jgi:hypothetical protein
MSTPEGVDLPVVAWIRWCSDGCYEGPLVDWSKRMDAVRRRSGAWTPLTELPAALSRIRSLQQEVERLRAAMAKARERIQEDRQALWECHVNQNSGQVTDPYGSEGIAEYDDVLRNIDDALGSTVAPGGQPSEMSK